MSVIAVTGIPFNWKLKVCVDLLRSKINGQFEALNFKNAPFGKRFARLKILYICLSELLDPQYVIQSINSSRLMGEKLYAYVPESVPDFPLKKGSTFAKKVQQPQTFKAPQSKSQKTYPLGQVLVTTHREIMDEMQYKYTGLFKLSKGTSHKLLDAIAKTICKRLTLILEADTSLQAFTLSKSYRKKHPHFGDFQMILSILHRLQDAAGEPRTQITEQELSVVCTQPNLVGNVPYAKVQKATHKYTDLIVSKLKEHIRELNAEINTETDNEEEIARKKVRAEMKKMAPYLYKMVRQIVLDNSNPPGRSAQTMFRIYGEPFVPPKDTMVPFLKKYHTAKMFRSERMFNILRFYVPNAHYVSLMTMDGTILGGAKLIIRPSDMTLYRMPDTFNAQMRAKFNGREQSTSAQPHPEAEEQYEDMDMAEDEEWNESWE